MIRKVLLAASALAVLSTAAISAEFARSGEPRFQDLGLSLAARKVITGLTPGVAGLVTISAEANVTAQCVNQNSEKASPTDTQPEPITVSGSQRIRKRAITAEGNTLMAVASQAPDLIIEGSPDCTNKHDVEVITDLSFTTAVITVQQPVGTTVLTATCTFSPPTTDGPVPKNTVNCVTS